MATRTVALEDGKYEFDIDEFGLMIAARRNGEPWPAGMGLRHTKVFMAALSEIEFLRLKLTEKGY